MIRDRQMSHGLSLETRVHLCPNWNGEWPHHIEIHLYSGDRFMGMMGYSAEEARRLADLLHEAASDLEGAG